MKKSKVYHLADIEPREIMPGFEARIIHSNKMTFAYWEIEKGSIVKSQVLPYEQVISMVMGEMEIKVKGKTINFHEGMVLVIPPNTKYSCKAITKCKILDVATPQRTDLE